MAKYRGGYRDDLDTAEKPYSEEVVQEAQPAAERKPACVLCFFIVGRPT